MEANPQRVEEFRQEIEAISLRAPDDSRERLFLMGGVVLPIVGLVIVALGWWGASGTAFVAEQIPYLLSGGVLGLGLIIVGAALFVRYSMTRYLRFWLIRLIHEERAQTDRSVAAMESIHQILLTAARARQKAD